MPFQSAMLLSFDSESESYAMGWAREDGTMVLPLTPTDPYAPDQELSVTRGSGDQCSRSVLIIDTANTHTIRRYVTMDSGHEELVLEMICTRM